MVKNKLIRLAELIQQDFPDDLLATFKDNGKLSLIKRIELVDRARASHQRRSETLWLQAGKQRTDEERCASAQAELAAFVFAYLTGDAKEYADSANDALRALGRQAEVELISSLCRRQR